MAKGPTAAEFNNFLAATMTLANEAAARQGLSAKIRRHGGFKFCFDNTRIHNKWGEVLKGGEWGVNKDGPRVPQPTYSPDFNRPIEHSFGRCVRAWNKGVVEQRINPYARPEPLMRELMAIFKSETKQQSIQKDVEGMTDLYKVVATPTHTLAVPGVKGSGGDWPPAKYYH